MAGSTSRRIAAALATMQFLGSINPSGSASGHTGYVIGTANGINTFISRVTAKTIKVVGKLTSASTGASVPRFYINGSEVFAGVANPFYNNSSLTTATIYSAGSDTTGVLLEIRWPDSGIPFYLGTPSSGTTGFDGYTIVIETDANMTGTLHEETFVGGGAILACPAGLLGTPVKLDVSGNYTDLAHNAQGEFRPPRVKTLCLLPNCTDVVIVQQPGLAAWVPADTARNYGQQGLRKDDNLRIHTTSLAESSSALLNGSLVGTVGLQAVTVATGITSGEDLWIALGATSANVGNPYWAILRGGAETLSQRSSYPLEWYSYDGGTSGGAGPLPRFATEQGCFAYPWLDGQNNALLGTYDAVETPNGVAIFGPNATFGWNAFVTSVAASKSERVNWVIAGLWTYEDNTTATGAHYMPTGALGAGGANLVSLTTPGQLRTYLGTFVDAIRNGTTWFGGSIAAIAKMHKLVFATYNNLSHNTYNSSSDPDAPYRIDADLYFSVHGTQLASKYSTGARVAYRTAISDAVTDINALYDDLDGNPIATFLDMKDARMYVAEYDIPGVSNGSCRGPGMPDGTWASRPFAPVTSSLGDGAHKNNYGNNIDSQFTLDFYLREIGEIVSAAPEVLSMTVSEDGTSIAVVMTRDVLNYDGFTFYRNGVALDGELTRVNAREYSFVLDTETIYEGDTITADYDDVAGDIVELYDLLPLATFSGEAADNQSQEQAPSGAGRARLGVRLTARTIRLSPIKF